MLRPLHRATIRVDGPDREAWLNGVITQDVPSVGQACYGLSLTRPGKITSDLFCLATGESLLVATPEAVQRELLTAWERMLVMEDVELSDASASWQWLLAIGSDHSSLRLPSGALVAELDFLALGGALVALPAEADVSALGAEVLTDDEWLELRLQRLVPEFGVDFDAKARPHEAALDQRAVSWTKGCYLGQEVVCMQQMRGKVRHRLEVLAARHPFEALPEKGAPVVDAAGTPVGHVTSAANDRRRGRGLLMAELDVAARNGALSVAGEPLDWLQAPLPR